MKQLLVVGLGNPGSQYANTRHNLGFMVIDQLKSVFNLPGWVKANRSRITTGTINGMKVILAKPMTYMNLSGQAVISLMTSYKISPGDLLVVSDDLALPFGRIRLRGEGSDGGHKGLMSIIEKTGRRDFLRLRIGIGQSPEYMESADYVLDEFGPEEKKNLGEILNMCCDAIKEIMENGLEKAMNIYNAKKIPPAEPEKSKTVINTEPDTLKRIAADY